MTEEEWTATPAGAAIEASLSYSVSAALLTMDLQLGKWASAGLNWFAHNIRAEDKPDNSRYYNAEHQQAARTGITIIAAWSACESGIESFFRGLMQMTPESQRFVGLEVGSRGNTWIVEESELASNEGRQKVYDGLKSSLGKKNYGLDRWEAMCAAVELAGPPIPSILERTFREAQQIRHVWAHNAGYADRRFVKNASGFDAEVGQLVGVPLKTCSRYIAALMVYAMIIANRHRRSYQLDPLPLDGPPAQGPIGKAYLSMYA